MVEQPYFGWPRGAKESDPPRDVAELTAECEAFAKEWDLTVRLSIEESWHAPGKTTLVEYRRVVKS